MKRHLPTILLLASLPAGLIGYALGVTLLRVLMPSQANGILMLFVPLLAGGLCMVPFLIPFIDRRAKADLAAHRAREAAATDEARPQS